MEYITEVCSVHDNAHNCFSLERHLVNRQTYNNDAPPHLPSSRLSQARRLFKERSASCGERFALD